MPFEKGKSGNPKGSRGKAADKMVRDAMRIVANETDTVSGKKKLRAAADAIMEKAIKGDVPAFNTIADRLDGKPAQAIVGDSDQDAIQVLQRIERIIVDPANKDS
jgi:hypothetical protein